MNEYASLALVTLLFLVGTLCSEWDCNVTLPWSVENSDHPVIPRRVLQDLLRCPHELHGCTPAPVVCDEQLFAVTCSCAKNCELYGDCCWDAGPNLSSITPATCVARNVDHHFGRNFYVIAVCNPKWPNDGVRQSCENATESKEAFYMIPVTTPKMVTYLNAFCALCNYDLDDSATFWNSTGKPGSGFQVEVPPVVLKHMDTFLRPCDPHLVNVFKCPEGADSEMARKCNTYFAPVEHIDNISDVVYKNVYCGLCNGAELSSLKCIPKRAVRETWVRVHIKTSFRPNLVSIMRPVLTQDSCFSWHDDKCYIKVPEYYYANHSNGDGSDNDLSVPSRTRIVAYNVQNYLTIICIVGTSAAINWAAPEFVLSPRYGRFGCWIGNLWSQLAFFLMPMMILLVLDIGLYVHTVVKIRRTAKRASIFDFSGGGSNYSHMRLYVKLAFIMGMTWMLGFITAFFNVLAMDIAVIVLIGLQGVYLFFGFRDYQHLIPKRFRKRRKCVLSAVPTVKTPVVSTEGSIEDRNVIRRRSSSEVGKAE
ncbi:hypothetical protein HPB50_002808 [Hyalomma asiaticum]|uniref:Uncharacterized protein n=1 Tax=Hyalomma asiaticum TaxID=266040 RepID=A0ACB7S525_HYAAI|nr:hypothetical protein HPB50_002808 [Hyalomma asiaticum]